MFIVRFWSPFYFWAPDSKSITTFISVSKCLRLYTFCVNFLYTLGSKKTTRYLKSPLWTQGKAISLEKINIYLPLNSKENSPVDRNKLYCFKISAIYIYIIYIYIPKIVFDFQRTAEITF